MTRIEPNLKARIELARERWQEKLDGAAQPERVQTSPDEDEAAQILSKIPDEAFQAGRLGEREFCLIDSAHYDFKADKCFGEKPRKRYLRKSSAIVVAMCAELTGLKTLLRPKIWGDGLHVQVQVYIKLV